MRNQHAGLPAVASARTAGLPAVASARTAGLPAVASARRRGAFAEAIAIGVAVANGMRITLLNMFRKPVTVHYPDVTRLVTDRFRGLLALTYDKETGEENCIGCRLCEFICPPAVIKVEMLKGEKRNYAKTFILELYACEFCELCVQVCPTDAIVQMKSFDMSTADRREMLLDKDRLHAIGLAHEASWATGTRLRDMQAPPKKTTSTTSTTSPPPPVEAPKPAVAEQA